MKSPRELLKGHLTEIVNGTFKPKTMRVGRDISNHCQRFSYSPNHPLQADGFAVAMGLNHLLGVQGHVYARENIKDSQQIDKTYAEGVTLSGAFFTIVRLNKDESPAAQLLNPDKAPQIDIISKTPDLYKELHKATPDQIEAAVESAMKHYKMHS